MTSETALSAEDLREKHKQHVHRGGCHRWFDHAANKLLDLAGPAGWCDGCSEDWPCDTTRALNLAVVGEPPHDAARSQPATDDGEFLAFLGGTWTAFDEERRRALFQRAESYLAARSQPATEGLRTVTVEALASALHAVDDDVQFIRRDARNFPVLAGRLLAALAASEPTE